MGQPHAGVGAVGQIAIPVRDTARSLAFYRDTLGLRFLFEAPPSLAFLQAGGVRLMLSGEGGGSSAMADANGQIVLYFSVESIEATDERLRSRGVEFVDRPHIVHKASGLELWMCFFHDPDGHALALMEERKV